jgi:hypothetical protein
MATKRIITQQDRDNARRLKRLWEQRKGDLGLTQISGAKALEISQPSFSQYLNCVIPLNTDAIIKFAELLRVNPVDIDPTLKNINSLLSLRSMQETDVRVPLIGSTSGKSVMGHAEVLAPNLPVEGTFAGIAVDDESWAGAGLRKGSLIALNLNAAPRIVNGFVAVREKDKNGFGYYQFQDDTGRSYRLKDPRSNNVRTVRHELVMAMHLVHAVFAPSE